MFSGSSKWKHMKWLFQWLIATTNCKGWYLLQKNTYVGCPTTPSWDECLPWSFHVLWKHHRLLRASLCPAALLERCRYMCAHLSLAFIVMSEDRFNCVWFVSLHQGRCCLHISKQKETSWELEPGGTVPVTVRVNSKNWAKRLGHEVVSARSMIGGYSARSMLMFFWGFHAYLFSEFCHSNMPKTTWAVERW